MYTGYKDHTGAKLFVNDKCTIDSGHSNHSDETGTIIYKDGHGFYFQYAESGDEVDLCRVFSELEKFTSTNTQSTKCSHEMVAVVAHYKCSKCGAIEEPVDE